MANRSYIHNGRVVTETNTRSYMSKGTVVSETVTITTNGVVTGIVGTGIGIVITQKPKGVVI